VPSFFTPHLKSNDKNLFISGEEHHHISHVFRKKINDELQLTNGKGLLASAKIISIKKKDIEVEILKIHSIKRSQPEMAAAFPLLKNKHDFMIVEKLTELGVKEFFPITTARTVRKPSFNTVEKFEKIAVAATKQCDNAFLPKVYTCTEIKELVQNLKNKNYLPVVALEFGEHKLISEIVSDLQQPVCLIIGPEGGFTKEEAEFLQVNEVIPFTLGNHILRAETAAIAAVSQLLAVNLKQDPEYY